MFYIIHNSNILLKYFILIKNIVMYDNNMYSDTKNFAILIFKVHIIIFI